MITFNQLSNNLFIRRRIKKRRRLSLKRSPQKKGQCMRVYTTSSKSGLYLNHLLEANSNTLKRKKKFDKNRSYAYIFLCVSTLINGVLISYTVGYWGLEVYNVFTINTESIVALPFMISCLILYICFICIILISLEYLFHRSWVFILNFLANKSKCWVVLFFSKYKLWLYSKGICFLNKITLILELVSLGSIMLNALSVVYLTQYLNMDVKSLFLDGIDLFFLFEKRTSLFPFLMLHTFLSIYLLITLAWVNHLVGRENSFFKSASFINLIWNMILALLLAFLITQAGSNDIGDLFVLRESVPRIIYKENWLVISSLILEYYPNLDLSSFDFESKYKIFNGSTNNFLDSVDNVVEKKLKSELNLKSLIMAFSIVMSGIAIIAFNGWLNGTPFNCLIYGEEPIAWSLLLYYHSRQWLNWSY